MPWTKCRPAGTGICPSSMASGSAAWSPSATSSPACRRALEEDLQTAESLINGEQYGAMAPRLSINPSITRRQAAAGRIGGSSGLASAGVCALHRQRMDRVAHEAAGSLVDQALPGEPPQPLEAFANDHQPEMGPGPAAALRHGRRGAPTRPRPAGPSVAGGRLQALPQLLFHAHLLLRPGHGIGGGAPAAPLRHSLAGAVNSLARTSRLFCAGCKPSGRSGGCHGRPRHSPAPSSPREEVEDVHDDCRARVAAPANPRPAPRASIAMSARACASVAPHWVSPSSRWPS